MHASWKGIIDNLTEDNYGLGDPLLRELILKVYNNKCVYTNQLLDPKNFEIDHFIPRRILPKNKELSLDNLVPSIPSFNHFKNGKFSGLNNKPDILSLGFLKQIGLKAEKIRREYKKNKTVKSKPVMRINSDDLNKNINAAIQLIKKSKKIKKLGYSSVWGEMIIEYEINIPGLSGFIENYLISNNIFIQICSISKISFGFLKEIEEDKNLIIIRTLNYKEFLSKFSEKNIGVNYNSFLELYRILGKQEK